MSTRADGASGRATTVAVVGSTGSIGTQTLAVIDAHPGRFDVVGLACGANTELLAEQVRRYRPRIVAVADATAATRARGLVGPGVEVLAGDAGTAQVAGVGADVVVNGMVSSRGLQPTLAALEAGSRLALANKESLIVGGPLVRAAASGPEQIVPVDSEHSAIAQCLRAGRPGEVERLILTASGGPFRGWSAADLADVTPTQALAHPTWDMGPVVTINSATLANKGLEVIEAHLLFDVPYARIEVTVHPQSVVHSMVEFRDGSVVAQLSPPDMRLPIQLALGWPDRLPSAPVRMDFTSPQTLEFAPVDADVFGMLDLARAAGEAGGCAPAVFNAANEIAVAAFLDGRLPFPGITAVVAAVLEVADAPAATSVETVLEAESRARSLAAGAVDRQ